MLTSYEPGNEQFKPLLAFVLTCGGALLGGQSPRRRAGTVESWLYEVHQSVVQQHGVPCWPIYHTVQNVCHYLALLHVSG